MTLKQVFVIVGIFFIGVAGWNILGSTSEFRSGNFYSSMDVAVQNLWGAAIDQKVPVLSVNIPGTKNKRILLPESNQVLVNIDLEQRKKGLIWYPTYQVNLKAKYTVKNTDAVAQNIRLYFPLPSEDATYDHFSFLIDDEIKNIDLNTKEGIHQLIEVQSGQTRSFSIEYKTRGLREWKYQLVGENGRVRNLDMLIKTNFDQVDYPDGSLSPMSVKTKNNITSLKWQAEDLITRQNIGLIMPEKINPGPLSARMSFFAPVCLLFFFVLISALSVIKNINIHPMHYLFVTAGFFAFHLLFAYLVDVINVHLAFWISSVVSIALVIFYLRSALGENFPWKIAAAGQMFYLVLFSYSFFIKGMTGLTVTIGSILTLAVLMLLTAKMDWDCMFLKKKIVVD